MNTLSNANAQRGQIASRAYELFEARVSSIACPTCTPQSGAQRVRDGQTRAVSDRLRGNLHKDGQQRSTLLHTSGHAG